MSKRDGRHAKGVVLGSLLITLPAWLACGGADSSDTTSEGPESGSHVGTGSSSGAGDGGASTSSGGGTSQSPEGSDAGADDGSDLDATLGADASDAGSTVANSPDGGVDAADDGLGSLDGGAGGPDGGPGALDGGSLDASSCAMGSGSTASQPGYLGDWTPGDYPSGFVDAGAYLTISGVAGQMGNSRQYAVHVPAGYRGDTPIPALFCIHGLGQTASLFCLDPGVDWPTKGDQKGFVVIMPNGYQNSWNGGTCCGGAAQAKLDDVGLIRAIFTEVGKHVNVDLGRVYATGLSNGGFLSYRLACEASDLFVAVAPSAGAVGTAEAGAGISALTTGLSTDLTTCAPTKKVSVLDIHGTSDPLVPYADQAPSIALIQAANGCSTTQQVASGPPSGGDTSCVSYTGCPSCPNVQVTACTVDGGGHCWFGSNDCGTGGGAIGTGIVGNNSNFMKNTDAIWNFFAPLSR